MKNILRFSIMMFCLFSGASQLHTQWVQTNGPNGANITCLAAIGTDIFAGTNGNGVFRSTNNGTSWTAVINGDTLNGGIGAMAVIGTKLFVGLNGGGMVSSVFIFRPTMEQAGVG